jgi:hypothetical protein
VVEQADGENGLFSPPVLLRTGGDVLSSSVFNRTPNENIIGKNIYVVGLTVGCENVVFFVQVEMVARGCKIHACMGAADTGKHHCTVSQGNLAS